MSENRFYRFSRPANKRSGKNYSGLVLIALGLLVFYCVVVPDGSGNFGRLIARVSGRLFGQAGYLLGPVLFIFGLEILRKIRGAFWRAFLLLLTLIFFATELSLISRWANQLNWGGLVGQKLSEVFRRLFGYPVGVLFVLILIFYLSGKLFSINWLAVGKNILEIIVADWQQWQQARRLQKGLRTAEKKVRSPQPSAPPPGAPPAPPKIIERPVVRVEKKPGPEKTAERLPQENSYFGYKLPVPELLPDVRQSLDEQKKEEHLYNADVLQKTLADFGIVAQVTEIIPGPVVTRYDLKLAPGVKIQAVMTLAENISLALKVPAVRIIPVPEKSAVGIEAPNRKSHLVLIKDILSSEKFEKSSSYLTIALGKTTDGEPAIADLMPFPHLLIAGATGSGKSVCIHSIIISVLYKARPDEVKFLLIDPKRLELPIYETLPHLYVPGVSPEQATVITQPKEAAQALQKLVVVMEKRYEKYAREMVRNIEGYNEKMTQMAKPRDYYILVIIDELADLMLVCRKEVEDSIQRLAQMARAVGIHLVLATQRPSVDVITGVIKANFPARIAFQTTTKVDSRVILDTIGAEDLLGRGDMLFLPPGEPVPIRLQGSYIAVKEVEKILDFIRQQNFRPSYELTPVKSQIEQAQQEESDDDLRAALRLVLERKRISQDLLKAHFGSSARATDLLSRLEVAGFIYKPEGTNRWQIFFDKIEEYLNNPSQ